MTKSYSFFDSRWLFTTLFLKLSLVWFSLFVNLIGEGWLIDKSNGNNLTGIGWFLTVLVVFLSVYIAVVERYHKVYNPEKKQAIIISAEKHLLDTINRIGVELCNYYLQFLEKNNK